MISSKDIQILREKTGLGIMECKKALEEASGNQKKAEEILQRSGAMEALKKSERQTSQGLIGSYVHSNGKIAVLIEVNCETDFVARNAEFQEFVHDLAMQVASMNPKDIDELKKQEFIKDTTLSIEDLLNQKIAKIGENIQIKRFVRYQLGE